MIDLIRRAGLACSLLLCLPNGLNAQGMSANSASAGRGTIQVGTTSNAKQAEFEPFLEYTPLGPTSSLRVPYWKKHLPADAGSFTMRVKLPRPQEAPGAFIWYEKTGTAIEGVHYQITSDNPLRILPGQTSADIQVDVLNSNEFFRERFLQVELTQSFNVEVNPILRVGQLWIRPSVDPPTATFEGTAFSVPAGQARNVRVELSHPSQDPVQVQYRIDGLSDLTEYTFPSSGSVIFAPGQTSTQLPFVCSPQAVPGQRLLMHLVHERNEVVHTIPALDANLSTNPDLYPQDIHIDENLWTFSVGGVQEFEHSQLRNPPAIGPVMPATPTDNITGGSFWEPGLEDQELVELVDQTDPLPILDPFSGVPLKIYAIGAAATQLTPYIRKSFNVAFCGGNTQLFELPEYVRVSYYIASPKGLDAARAVPFFRAGIRVRSQDLNHGITFRIGSTGTDSAGNPIQTVNTSLGRIGVWSTDGVNNATDRYGIVEDEFGVRVWYAHRLDPTVAFVHPVAGDLRFETPGVDRGNPIEYPFWVSTGDGSLASMGLSSVDDATGLGNLAYGFMWEISDEDAIFGDQLRPYFPKPGSWWEPVGNMVLDQTTSLFFIVQ